MPNEGDFPDSIGIDTLTIASAGGLIFFYIIAGFMTDKIGLVMVIVGSCGFALSTWIWYFAKETIEVVLAAKLLGVFCGALITTGLLHVSNRWFPPKERPFATAVMTVTGTFL